MNYKCLNWFAGGAVGSGGEKQGEEQEAGGEQGGDENNQGCRH